MFFDLCILLSTTWIFQVFNHCLKKKFIGFSSALTQLHFGFFFVGILLIVCWTMWHLIFILHCQKQKIYRSYPVLFYALEITNKVTDINIPLWQNQPPLLLFFFLGWGGCCIGRIFMSLMHLLWNLLNRH